MTIILCTFFLQQKPALFEDSDFEEENNDFYIRPQFHGKKGRKVKDSPLGSCGCLFSYYSLSPYFLWLYAILVTHTHARSNAHVCVCVCAMHVCMHAYVCLANVTVKRPALLPCAVDGCYRNHLYYYNMHTNTHTHTQGCVHTCTWTYTCAHTHTHACRCKYTQKYILWVETFVVCLGNQDHFFFHSNVHRSFSESERNKHNPSFWCVTMQ